MAPGGITFRFSSVSAKTYRVPGRHECLPYSKNATCSEINKQQFVSLFHETESNSHFEGVLRIIPHCTA